MIPALTDNHRRALRILLDVLNQNGIDYQITGGLAGNVYGSTWPLHDIDIDVERANIPVLLEKLNAPVIRPFDRFVDEEFDIYLATVMIADIEIDMSQVEDAYVYHQGTRVPLETDLRRAETHVLEGRGVQVQRLDDLIAYKELLGRTHDLADLYRLRAKRTQSSPQVRE